MRLLLLLIVITAAGCSSYTDEELWLKVEGAKSRSNWDSTLQVAQKILDEYPDGRFGGWARFAVAESYRFKNQPREALDNYKIFIDRYPAMPPAAVSTFLVGFLYANNLQLNDSAKFYYEFFLQKYPDHELAPTVTLELETIGMSPQEVLELRSGQQRPIVKK